MKPQTLDGLFMNLLCLIVGFCGGIWVMVAQQCNSKREGAGVREWPVGGYGHPFTASMSDPNGYTWSLRFDPPYYILERTYDPNTSTDN